MSKTNGQTDIHVEEQDRNRELEHELPAADPGDGYDEKRAAAADPAPAGELQKLQAERDQLLDRLARLQAEFDNARKRAARENAEFRDYAVGEAARALIPVIDNFNLALRNSGASPEEFRKGVELIARQLQDVLQKMNVQRIPAQGEPFDPRVHEAIEMAESNDVKDNHVLEELQPGYRIKDRLLRPAMVRVAKNVKKQG